MPFDFVEFAQTTALMRPIRISWTGWFLVSLLLITSLLSGSFDLVTITWYTLVIAWSSVCVRYLVERRNTPESLVFDPVRRSISERDRLKDLV